MLGGTDRQFIYNNNGVADGGDAYYDNSTGNFGIGTNAPEARLHLVSDDETTTPFRIDAQVLPLQWWNLSWTKRNEITITGSASDLTDFPVLINLTYDSDMKADFSDIRFAQQSGLLTYWIESYTSSISARIWVKIPNLPTTGTSVYLYYGNPVAVSVSDPSVCPGGAPGGVCCNYSDNFSDGNYNGWTVAGGTWSASEFYLKGTTDASGIYTTDSVIPSGPKEWLFRIKNHGTGGSDDQYHPRMMWSSDNDYLKVYLRTYASTDQYLQFIQKVAGVETVLHQNNKYNYHSEAGNWFWIKVTKSGNAAKFRVWKDGTTEPTSWDWEGTYSSSLIDSGQFYNRVELTNASGVGLDDIRVRRLASPEPTASTGSEEEVPPPSLQTAIALEPLTGNLGIGTDDPNGYRLFVAGSAYSTGGWSSSDARWKKNVTPIEYALETVLKLRGVKYDWNLEAYPDQGFTTDRQIGLIAQEVERIIPEVVHADPDGFKSLSYEKLSAILIEAIKELEKEKNQQIEELKHELEALENRLESLERGNILE